MPSNESVKKALALIDNDKTKLLGVTFGTKTVEPGVYIAKAEAQETPRLSFGGANPETTYIVVGLDLDAPFLSFTLLGPILHWTQSGLKKKADGTDALEETEPFVANWIGPAPPPGSGPHRYAFFLYEQPAGFDAKARAPPNGKNLGNLQRMRYSLDDLEKDANLGTVIAANYFTSN